jgi:hypothetical protein
MNNPTINPSNISGGIPNSPLLLFQPLNIIVFLCFFSPIIISICMLSLSLVFQNFKGFIYLGYLLGVCVIRSYIYMLNKSQPVKSDGSICTSIQYAPYGNSTFSAFVFAFTIMYISMPMFINGEINFYIFGGLLIYFFVDIFIKVFKKCVIKTSDLFINILLGLASAALIVSLMYAGGSSKYLFFNETSSTKEVCSVSKNQNFKCSIFKNGELISAMNT